MLIFSDSFERVSVERIRDEWARHEQAERRVTNVLVIEGPTWWYIGPSGIVITRTDEGHRISRMER